MSNAQFRVGRYNEYETQDAAVSAAGLQSLHNLGKPVTVWQAVKTVKVALPTDSSLVQVSDWAPSTDESDDD